MFHIYNLFNFPHLPSPYLQSPNVGAPKYRTSDDLWHLPQCSMPSQLLRSIQVLLYHLDCLDGLWAPNNNLHKRALAAFSAHVAEST